MPDLSKSKIMAYRQCPKRLWLEIHRPELRDDTSAQAVFAIGHQVGDIARRVFDPGAGGSNVDPNAIGWDDARRKTEQLIQAGDGPIFEAYIQTPGAMALVDVLLPVRQGDALRWQLIEVKSSASVKDPHRDDAAIQAYIASRCGLPVDNVAVAHIDTSFVYPGDEQYQGLFAVADLTEETNRRQDEAECWIREATEIATSEEVPAIEVGPQCTQPYTCPFHAHCHQNVNLPEDPFHMLPRARTGKKASWLEAGIHSLSALPDSELTAIQRRVKEAHVSGVAFHDREGSRNDLAPLTQPSYFLDFETVSFAVPIWAGTRPFKQIPFQYSVHVRFSDGRLRHREFLQIDGADPRRALAQQLVTDCDEAGPVFVYSAKFERAVLEHLANAVEELRNPLLAIKERLVDLLPVAQKHYYHPCQNGSWSLKAVIPSIAPELDYARLDGIQDGGAASAAFHEAAHPDTTPERRQQIRDQLRIYCAHDTLATVRIFEHFSK